MPQHLSAAGFRASLGLLSDLGKSLDGDVEWLFLGTVWLLGSGGSPAMSFYFLEGKTFLYDEHS